MYCIHISGSILAHSPQIMTLAPNTYDGKTFIAAILFKKVASRWTTHIVIQTKVEHSEIILWKKLRLKVVRFLNNRFFIITSQ